MKSYKRTEWYGLEYLFHVRGSVIFRCIPAVVVGCLVNWAVLEDHIPLLNQVGEDGSGEDLLSHPYTFQLVGIVFGYLTIYRINISYQRYWEGVTMVKNMHSKWADACGQVVSFDRSHSGELDLTSDPFCCHIIRLFSQMSAMATMRLHVVEPGESILFEALESRSTDSKLKPLGTAKSSKELNKPSLKKALTGKVHPDNGDGKLPSLAHFAENRSKAALGAVAQVAEQGKDAHAAHKEKSRKEKINELAAGISPTERNFLLSVPDPVFATALRIQRAIITRWVHQLRMAPTRAHRYVALTRSLSGAAHTCTAVWEPTRARRDMALT